MTLDTDQPSAGNITTGRSWRDLPQSPPEVDEPGAIPDLAMSAPTATATQLVEPPAGTTTVEIPPSSPDQVPVQPRPASPPPDKPRGFMERWGWALGAGGVLALLIALFAWAPWDDDPNEAALAGVDEPIADVAASLLPSVVQIERAGMVGSGFAYADGRVLTAAHVVAGATEVTVRTSDGRELTGTVLGGDSEADVAVVAVDDEIPAAPLSLEDPVRVGQVAIAIGSPLGFDQSVTSGIVSAVDRELDVPGGGHLENLIQTDAPINQGNSGGPLADQDGRVIGVNVAIASFSGGSDGLGFAVAIDEAVAIADQFSTDDPQPESLDPGSTVPGLDDFGGAVPPELRDLLDQFLQDPQSIQPDDLAPLMDDFLDQFGDDLGGSEFLDDPQLRDLLDELLQDPGAVGPEDLAPLLDDFLLGDEVDPMLENLLDQLYDNLLGE
ncbi:MAG TPA: trypsin-like peptidase domain-containing protein [Acidimicrobiia bacterium]